METERQQWIRACLTNLALQRDEALLAEEAGEAEDRPGLPLSEILAIAIGDFQRTAAYCASVAPSTNADAWTNRN